MRTPRELEEIGRKVADLLDGGGPYVGLHLIRQDGSESYCAMRRRESVQRDGRDWVDALDAMWRHDGH